MIGLIFECWKPENGEYWMRNSGDMRRTFSILFCFYRNFSGETDTDFEDYDFGKKSSIPICKTKVDVISS